MPTPNPRYGSRFSMRHRSMPLRSRWTARRQAVRPAAGTEPPPPTCDFIVSGTISPDATGDYTQDGIFEGKPIYWREDNAFCLYWLPYLQAWILALHTSWPSAYWFMHDPDPPGNYEPVAPYTGWATVAAP